VTRARLQFRVFSTMTADQIDLSRTQAKGARLLKAFLRYAASQSAPSRTGSQGDFDSDFERQVFDVLVSRGWEVDSQVGCGAYRIDLAVVHPQKPGVYALAVECDGAPYHSAATARDRDRLRQQVLEGLGWRVHRVWSTDWWFARDQEITRLEEAIDRALAEGPPGPPPVAAPVVALPAMEAEAPAKEATPGASPYVVASLQRLSADPESLHAFQHLDALVAACEAVVAVEAPILLDELARRVLPAFGATTLTERARRRVQDAVRRSRKVRMEGEVCWRPKDDPASWSTFRTGVREIDQIPVEELAAATEWVLVRNVALPRKALAKEAARMVGVERLGARVAARMDLAIDLLMRRGRARQEGDQVTRIA
jgi:very-short-patch-repair endonuclease